MSTKRHKVPYYPKCEVQTFAKQTRGRTSALNKCPIHCGELPPPSGVPRNNIHFFQPNVLFF